jgi:hypothetical protein
MVHDRNKTESKKLRQKLFMVFHEDGILDLVAGMTILLLAAVMAFDSVLIGLIGIPIVFYIPIKEQVSIPRLGLIRFNPEAETRKKLGFLVLLGVFVFIGLLLLAFTTNKASNSLIDIIGNNEVLIFAGLFGGTLFVAGLALNNPRFVYYAILGVILVCSAFFLRVRIWIPVAIVGAIVECLAVYYLVRFTRAYPLSKDE